MATDAYLASQAQPGGLEQVLSAAMQPLPQALPFVQIRQHSLGLGVFVAVVRGAGFVVGVKVAATGVTVGVSVGDTVGAGDAAGVAFGRFETGSGSADGATVGEAGGDGSAVAAVDGSIGIAGVADGGRIVGGATVGGTASEAAVDWTGSDAGGIAVAVARSATIVSTKTGVGLGRLAVVANAARVAVRRTGGALHGVIVGTDIDAQETSNKTRPSTRADPTKRNTTPTPPRLETTYYYSHRGYAHLPGQPHGDRLASPHSRASSVAAATFAQTSTQL